MLEKIKENRKECITYKIIEWEKQKKPPLKTQTKKIPSIPVNN